MRLWPLFGRAEQRAEGLSAYERMILEAATNPPGNAGALGVVAACSTLWADALSSLEVTGPEAVNGEFLATVGCDLIRAGYSRWAVGVADGAIRLARPTRAERVSGGWLLTWDTDPGESRTETRLASEVVNLRWEHSRRNDWDAVPPWASLSGEALAELDAVLRDEFQGPQGSVLVSRLAGIAPDQTTVKRKQKGLEPDSERGKLNLRGPRRGSLVVLASAHGPNSGLHGDSAGRPMRVGANPPEGVARIRDSSLAREIAGSCGCPFELVAGGAGAAVREAQRIFFGRVQQRASRIAYTLSASLGVNVALEWKAAKLDVQQRARALKSLVDAGLGIEDARAIVGV